MGSEMKMTSRVLKTSHTDAQEEIELWRAKRVGREAGSTMGIYVV